MADGKQKTVAKKELPDGHVLSLVRYSTEHPKTMSASTRMGFHPGFDCSYEMILCLDRTKENQGRWTHPKLSWYLSRRHFTELYDSIESAGVYKIVERAMGNLTFVSDHNIATQKVDGLLRLLQGR